MSEAHITTSLTFILFCFDLLSLVLWRELSDCLRVLGLYKMFVLHTEIPLPAHRATLTPPILTPHSSILTPQSLYKQNTIKLKTEI